MDRGAARAVEARVASRAERGKADIARIDYSYYVDWNAETTGRVAIVPRPRGSPLDKLVAELMIHVNNSWGRLLRLARVPGLYRTQSCGKVKMSLRPGEHQGLGRGALPVGELAAAPLLRPRQPAADPGRGRRRTAALRGQRRRAVRRAADFEATYRQYAEFQDRMEHYWCLRWLLQEGVEEITGTVVRETLVRFDRVPLYQRLADLPALPQDTAVRIGIGRVDLLASTMECRYAGPAD